MSTINAENDARDYSHLAKNPEKMKQRFFSGITRFADGKKFEDVGRYEAIVKSLPTATSKDIHLGNRFDQDENLEEPDAEPIQGHKAIVNDRTGKVADIVTDSYTKTDHSEVFEPLAQAMRELPTKCWGSVRTFKGGNRVHAAVMTNEAFQIEEDSSYHIGFMMSNSYDRSSGIRLQAFNLRGVCSNGCLWNAGDIGEPMTRKHVGDPDIAGKYREFIQEIIDNSHKIREELVKAQEQVFVEVDVYRVLRNAGIPKGKIDEILQLPTARGKTEVTRKELYDAVTRWVSRLDENDQSMSSTTERRYQRTAQKILSEDTDDLTTMVGEDRDQELEEVKEIESIAV